VATLQSDVPKVSRPVRLGLVVTFIVFGLYFAYLLAGSNFRSSSHMPTLAREFAAATPPSSTQQVSELRRSSKLIVQSVSADFQTSLTPKEIEQHYEKVLQANGWRLLARRASESSKWRDVRFCKNDLEAVLQVKAPEGSQTRYYFGVQWEGGPYTRTGC